MVHHERNIATAHDTKNNVCSLETKEGHFYRHVTLSTVHRRDDDTLDSAETREQHLCTSKNKEKSTSKNKDHFSSLVLYIKKIFSFLVLRISDIRLILRL